MLATLGLHNVMLCLAGASGELSGDVRQLQEDYPGRIVVRENVTQEEKYAMYSAVDMLVAPSFAQRAYGCFDKGGHGCFVADRCWKRWWNS